MKKADACPFCCIPPGRLVLENEHGYAIRDLYPISAGHTLIVLKRHEGSFFKAGPVERTALLCLLDEAKIALDSEFRPAGFNVGINDGIPAGQTIPHLHIHLIPRYVGDTVDPRGGVRWVLPAKARYWK